MSIAESISRLSKFGDVSLISLKNNLVKDQKMSDLVIVVREKVNSLPKEKSYKTDVEIVLYVCKLVENFILKSDNVSKKEFVIQILCSVLCLDLNEIEICKGMIDFLWNNQLILKTKISKVVKNEFVNLIKKKVL